MVNFEDLERKFKYTTSRLIHLLNYSSKAVEVRDEDRKALTDLFKKGDKDSAHSLRDFVGHIVNIKKPEKAGILFNIYQVEIPLHYQNVNYKHFRPTKSLISNIARDVTEVLNKHLAYLGVEIDHRDLRKAINVMYVMDMRKEGKLYTLHDFHECLTSVLLFKSVQMPLEVKLWFDHLLLFDVYSCGCRSHLGNKALKQH
jgi:phage-related protein